VAIAGSRTDGHQWAAQAVAAGAVAVVASRPVDVAAPVFLVSDTVHALGLLAQAWRRKTRARVVAVTGSAGKTTVKEMLACVLGEVGQVGKNPGNFNNQVGLPLAILAFGGEEDFWVVEVGISQPGDMDALGAITTPDVALITNAGLAHAEHLGGVDGVARHKARLLEWRAPHGLGVWNAGCPALHAACSAICPNGITFAEGNGEATVRVLHRTPTPEGWQYRVHTPSGVAELVLPMAAAHPGNVAAVVAVAWGLGVPMDAVEQGLRTLRPQSGRFVLQSYGSWTLIDDTYNANPLSMAASLTHARHVAGERPLVAVLGEMRELGPHSSSAHQELGALARQLGCRALVFRGEDAPHVAAGWGGEILATEDPAAAWRAVAAMGLTDPVVLFKGSRGSHMEEFLSYFQERLA